MKTGRCWQADRCYVTLGQPAHPLGHALVTLAFGCLYPAVPLRLDVSPKGPFEVPLMRT